MKRILLVVILALGIVSFASAQVDFNSFQIDFESFASAIAGTLASTTSSAGLAWSPAYIGQFPHLGVGVSVGAALMPYSAISPIVTMVGATIPPALSALQTYGVPLPAASVDARLGGFILPFDVGLKVGYLPPEAKQLLGSINLDYLLVGADVRLDILKDEGFSPALSIGVGYTYFQGSVGLPGLLSGATDVDITSFMNAAGYSGPNTLQFTSPDLTFNWQSNVIEAKVQLSKQLLIFIPHVGLDVSYGISKAGGGLASTMTYTGSATFAQMQAAFVKAGYPAPNAQGMTVLSDASGLAFRAYGGLDLALLIVHLDFSGTYDILTGAYGGGLNLRVQL